MSFYDVLKSFATLGTKENQELKIELQKFMVRIADGKYTGKSAKDIFTDYNAIREKHGFKAYNFLQEDVIRKDFNGELNRDFDGNVIDEDIESLLEAVASKGTLMKNARAIQAKLRTTTDPEEIRKMIEQLESITKVLENPDLTNAKVSMRKGKVVEK